MLEQKYAKVTNNTWKKERQERNDTMHSGLNKTNKSWFWEMTTDKQFRSSLKPEIRGGLRWFKDAVQDLCV